MPHEIPPLIDVSTLNFERSVLCKKPSTQNEIPPPREKVQDLDAGVLKVVRHDTLKECL